MHKLIKQAFTLIELLVVIAIIGILSGLIIVGMNGMTQKANIAKAQVFSNSLRNSLMANLISEWKLDGNANDTWGGYNGTISGNNNWMNSDNCIYGTCFRFDGSTWFQTNISPTTQGTIGAWFYRESADSRIIIGSHSTSPLELRCYLGVVVNGTSTPRLGGGIGSNSWGIIYGSTSLDINKWYYGIIGWDGSRVKLYVNGVKDYDDVQNGATSTVTPFYIGAQNINSTGDIPFVGRVDEIRFFSTILSTSKIKEQYYAGLNNLLAKGEITKEDYQNRIGELATNL